MNNPVWIDDKGKIVEPEYCRDFLSRHPMRCINDRFYTVDGQLPDENKLKRTIYEEISPWLHAKAAQTVEQIITFWTFSILRVMCHSRPIMKPAPKICMQPISGGVRTTQKTHCPQRASQISSAKMQNATI
jgi:hypothetical protein